ncbi:RcnB family protein [Henriciella aquimarina]|uniref:RcnB family protein n=1 Tax=Henriciella aquimarina TaxID=545261 RepID=UPI000A05F50B|nr:RcnB family protein [Henriciella aquimarina]
MALFSYLARIGAIGALAFAVLAPASMADERGRGDRGGHHDRGDRGHRGGDWNRGDRGHRGDWNRGSRDHRRDWNRHHNNRHDWDRGRRHARDWNRHHRPARHWNNHYRSYRPRVINRYYYSAPRYAYPRPRSRVIFHYNSGYYHNGYRIGGYYDYSPRTIIINDYGRYGLYRPPHGHHWVRDPYSDDAVLTSVATGAIIGLAVGILSQ